MLVQVIISRARISAIVRMICNDHHFMRSSIQFEGRESEVQFRTISSIGLFPNRVIRIQTIKKMAAISRAIKTGLFSFWRKAEIIVIMVAVMTRETSNVLNECSIFCCCSTYVEGDNSNGLNPIHMPKLTPASNAAIRMFTNLIVDLIMSDLKINKSGMKFVPKTLLCDT